MIAGARLTGFVITALFALSLVSCLPAQMTKNESAGASASAETNLRQFAYVNCLYWYFEKKGYETKDLRSISGGIVELGYSSADKYRRIASFMRDYKPDIKSKSNIDVDLYKCFKLEESVELNRLIESPE